MSRFHFHIYDGVTALDRDGTELASVDAARAEGMRLAGHLLSAETNSSRLGEEWRLEVTDDRGMILFRIDVMVSASSAVQSDGVDRGEPAP